MNSPWGCLESVPGLCALPGTWRAQLAEHYEAFKAAFLQSRPDRRARFFPCPNGCPSWHEVFWYGPQDIVAACRCESSSCGDLALTQANIVPFELSWPKLARALCEALGFAGKFAPVGIQYTRQIGAWSAGSVPALLTIQTNRLNFRSVVTELGARLRQPFILLAPSARNVDAVAQEFLANLGAGFFSLEAHIRLCAGGTLICPRPPGELFAKFTPVSKEPVPEDEARTAFAIVRSLDSELTARKAPIYTVFRLYCIEGLTAEQVARQCHCARSLIFARLESLRQKLGRDPTELREYSAHFERIEESLSDPRARRIFRKGAAYGDDAGECEE